MSDKKPVGRYNPDWAIAFYEGTVKYIYFVAETKGSMSSMQFRLIEKSKIHCAREHFRAISNGEVVYDVVDSYKTLLEQFSAHLTYKKKSKEKRYGKIYYERGKEA